MGLYKLLFTSKASNKMTESDIFKIVDRAKKVNAAHNITGLLLYVNDSFIQLLEGNEEDVKQLSSKITQDERHEQVRTIIQGPAKKRDFDSWNMGLKIYTEQDIEDLKQINKNPDFNLLSDLQTKQDLTIELLRYFYKFGKIDFNHFWTSNDNNVELVN